MLVYLFFDSWKMETEKLPEAVDSPLLLLNAKKNHKNS